jgi:4-hydroxymandelate oxidase
VTAQSARSSAAEIERLAAVRLPPAVRDFVAGGSGAEVTLAANRAAFDRIAIVPRVLSGEAGVRMETQLVRTKASMPVAVAPVAYQRLMHPDGEVAAARAAKTSGIPYVISMLSSYPMEEIVGTGASCWFQLYWLRDRGQNRDLVLRAGRAGCEALVVTVDLPIMGRRMRDVRNEFALPTDVRAVHLEGDQTTSAHVAWRGNSAVAVHTSELLEPALSWCDLEWLRERTDLPIVIKGILDPRDAVRAAEIGADAVVVSNHGGRQLDSAVPSIMALSPIVDAVGDRCEVLLDSGVRTGTDVVKALASGASGVLIGRPVQWGLAVGAEEGVASVLELLRSELEECLRLAGCIDLVAARELRVTTV